MDARARDELSIVGKASDPVGSGFDVDTVPTPGTKSAITPGVKSGTTPGVDPGITPGISVEAAARETLSGPVVSADPTPVGVVLDCSGVRVDTGYAPLVEGSLEGIVVDVAATVCTVSVLPFWSIKTRTTTVTSGSAGFEGGEASFGINCLR